MSDRPLRKSKSRIPIHFEVGRIRVEFLWQNDRWQHLFRLDHKNYLQSVEGGKFLTFNERATGTMGISENWPASPVITEVTSTKAKGHQALVAIGLAGRSHFSASLTASTTQTDTILVEVACRISERPEWLGSTYSCDQKVPSDGLIAIKPASLEPFNRPLTVVWSYCVSVGGIEAVPPASCGRLIFPSNC